MVLVLSLQDDPNTNLNWLDSSPNPDQITGKYETMAGPCFGLPGNVREKHPKASVKYSNFRYGDIGHAWVHPPPRPTTSLQPGVLEEMADGALEESEDMSTYLSKRPKLMWRIIYTGIGLAVLIVPLGLFGWLWAQGYRCSCCCNEKTNDKQLLPTTTYRHIAVH